MKIVNAKPKQQNIDQGKDIFASSSIFVKLKENIKIKPKTGGRYFPKKKRKYINTCHIEEGVILVVLLQAFITL